MVGSDVGRYVVSIECLEKRHKDFEPGAKYLDNPLGKPCAHRCRNMVGIVLSSRFPKSYGV